MNIHQYIQNINIRYKLGNATEHTFRGDLQQLLESLVPDIRATNEPKRQSCGAPDYILTKKEIPVGFVEAKDIGDKDLEGSKNGNKEQFDRYKTSLNNIVFTDYLDFYLYRDGQLIMKIAIGQVTPKGIKPLTENFDRFETFINKPFFIKSFENPPHRFGKTFIHCAIIIFHINPSSKTWNGFTPNICVAKHAFLRLNVKLLNTIIQNIFS
jgi:hypothetical protein